MEKPSRYINHELNAFHKDFNKAQVRFCFAFPDVYEVGFSHLGLKILYTILNELDFAMADRTYLPWLDALQLLRQENIPLFGLESKRAVIDFDAVGITLQSELTYTNVLELLDISGIPLHSSNRSDTHPIILAGGPCASNPLPLAPFIDAFLIGEGEEAITEIAEILKHKANGKRSDILHKLSAIAGLYVPAVHDKLISTGELDKIKIRKYNEFADGHKSHRPQLMAWQLATHNRYVAEIMRGCTRGCRFCHAGYFYRPVRERSPENILDDLLQEIEQYGWEEAGLVSLSSSDYTCIKPLLEALLKKIDQQKIHVSLPSLRVDSFDDKLITLLKEVGREGLTIAPEAGSQRLRDVINKNLSETEILQGVTIAKQLGWQRLKLYFMLGLPTETDADIEGIIELIDKIIREAGKSFQINVSLSPFVPKPHTPFQWSAMLHPDELLRRALSIKHYFQRYRFVKIRYHTIESSLLETNLSRGDKQIATLIEEAWKAGAMYDGWNEGFVWNNWVLAAEKIGFDLYSACRESNINSNLPWDFIDIGIDKNWLKQERDNALMEKPTPDCRTGCILCGVCQAETTMQTASDNAAFEKFVSNLPLPDPKTKPGIDHKYIKKYPYRLLYAKGGDFRYIGHLDWMRMVFRIMGSSKLPIVYTQGYNPHPKVSFGPALAVGMSGTSEFLDFNTSVPLSSNLLENAFRPLFNDGLELISVTPVIDEKSINQPLIDVIVISVPHNYLERVQSQINLFNKSDKFEFVKHRKDTSKTYDLRQVIVQLKLAGDELHLEKLLQSPNIYDLLSAILVLDKIELSDWEISRIAFKH